MASRPARHTPWKPTASSARPTARPSKPPCKRRRGGRPARSSPTSSSGATSTRTPSGKGRPWERCWDRWSALAIYRWSNIWGIPLGVWIALPAPARRRDRLPARPAATRSAAGWPASPGSTREPAAAPPSPSSTRRSSAPGTAPASSCSSRSSSAASCCSPTPASIRRWRRERGRRSPAGWPQGIRAARPTPALIEAIRACGELLERHDVAREPDDADELSDELRLERE